MAFFCGLFTVAIGYLAYRMVSYFQRQHGKLLALAGETHSTAYRLDKIYHDLQALNDRVKELDRAIDRLVSDIDAIDAECQPRYKSGLVI